MEFYRYHTLYRPREIVTVFSVPAQGVRLWNEGLIVYDVRIGQGILRHYGFRDRWFEVNVSLDRTGNFVTEHLQHGPLPGCVGRSRWQAPRRDR